MEASETPGEAAPDSLRALPESASAGDEMALPGAGTSTGSQFRARG